MYFIEFKKKIENFKINNNFSFKSEFLNLLKKYVKFNKYLNIFIKMNGCKGYMCNFYISNLKKNLIILNFKYLNLSFKFDTVFYIINSTFNIFKKKYVYILIFVKNSIICKCGTSFYIK